MATLLLLTNALAPSAEVLPALGLLLHTVRVAPAEASALMDTAPADVLLVDGRRELPATRSLCRVLRTTGLDCPMLLITTEGGLAAVTAEWGVDDVLLDTSGPAEVEARIRLAVGRMAAASATRTCRWRSATATSRSTRRRTPRGCVTGSWTSPSRSSSC